MKTKEGLFVGEDGKPSPYQMHGEAKDRKIIRVVWRQETGPYGFAMQVVYSNHPRFTAGYRFDWGFAEIATQVDGYELQIAPLDRG